MLQLQLLLTIGCVYVWRLFEDDEANGMPLAWLVVSIAVSR